MQKTPTAPTFWTSVERYRSWLKSDFVRIWVAQTTTGGSANDQALRLRGQSRHFNALQVNGI